MPRASTAAATRASAVPAPLLVLAAVVSVQFGGALAATLVPEIGAAGSVTLRLLFAALVLGAVARPRLRGHSRSAWLTVVLFGLALGLMNLSFYASLARLPIGVAVTIEFLGPLTLATVLSRRLLDVLAVVAAGAGVTLISQALTVPLADLDWVGLGLAATAGACWAAYIILSRRTGAAFASLDGLALAMGVALVAVAPFGLGTVPLWSGEVVAKGLGIALLSSVLPYSLELLALRRLSPRVFGILLSLEPAAAALAGWLVLGQSLTGHQLTGMALVVAASAVVMGAGRRRQPADPAAIAQSG
ncbi:EamA family transporter [Phycicoccus sp. SLBN-51]|uniref:EamA family transporter n=1 Tax=Phycicoccus sp. SLBN-51 TaxID=2768447 RepID=UPI00116B2382|nr:EamA family transporter [Phycicoccus sp. SLBN-51]TQJ50974.1 inner membrane transporter RhtA [Phycicoccus sp. SLBN-51]